VSKIFTRLAFNCIFAAIFIHMNENIHPIFKQLLERSHRERFLNQTSKIIWLTGLSGSGKSAIASTLEKLLFEKGYFSLVLDGDNIRSGINSNLGFSLEDRLENIRRIAEVSKLFLNSGMITINSFVSPTREIRQLAKSIIGEEDFIEVFIDTPLSICEKRDVKGLYKKARRGEIPNFTGIDSPYEKPLEAELIVKTENQTVMESTLEVLDFITPIISIN
jgi:adenylylsulfate kinase